MNRYNNFITTIRQLNTESINPEKEIIKIAKSLDMYVVEGKKKKNINELKNQLDEHNIILIHNINGSQNSPDFMLICRNKKDLYIECKSSTQGIIVWNGGAKNINDNYLYFFANTGKSTTPYLFIGVDYGLSSTHKSILEEYEENTKALDRKYNEVLASLGCPIKCYSRAMYNERIKYANNKNNDANHNGALKWLKEEYGYE